MFTPAITTKQVLMDTKLTAKLSRIARYNLLDRVDFAAPNFREHVDSILRENIFNKFRASVRHFSYLEERAWFCKNAKLQYQLLQVIKKGLGHNVNVVAPDFALHLDCLLYRDAANKYPLYAKYIPGAPYLGRLGLREMSSLDQLLYQAIEMGHGAKINVTVPCLSIHLEELIYTDCRFYIFRKYVPNFCYLEECGWFTESVELQEKLRLITIQGGADEVDVFNPDFAEHLDDLLF